MWELQTSGLTLTLLATQQEHTRELSFLCHLLGLTPTTPALGRMSGTGSSTSLTEVLEADDDPEVAVEEELTVAQRPTSLTLYMRPDLRKDKQQTRRGQDKLHSLDDSSPCAKRRVQERDGILKCINLAHILD